MSAFCRRAYEEDGQWLALTYECPNCDTSWHDEWSCEVDDDCPTCGTSCSPADAEEIEID
ncbi:MAG: hypothetical protein ACK4TR_08790 [Phenylobacterium sp.]|uniref:hypothetical protein n=1 Tax=Phenylobacterium sp. TaxID=1871053 RepID=UPI00391B4509